MGIGCAVIIAFGIIVGALFIAGQLAEITKQMKSLWLAVARISAKPPEDQ